MTKKGGEFKVGINHFFYLIVILISFDIFGGQMNQAVDFVFFKKGLKICLVKIVRLDLREKFFYAPDRRRRAFKNDDPVFFF